MHVRAILALSGENSFVVYLPEGVAGLLPLQARFGARLVAQLQMAVNLQDPGPGR